MINFGMLEHERDAPLAGATNYMSNLMNKMMDETTK